MIPVANIMTQVDNIVGEEIEFGIGDPRFVMMTQADLYSDITTAIIREYSTNAYDSHVMAGNTDPIEVSLPSMMNPYFKVVDKGVGMDIDMLRRVYTQFGVSDKRGLKGTNGMLGYGSKSGVAYTNTFTVTSVRDGIKNIGVVTRRPDWSIFLKVVSSSRTDEPNGTEIRIPVHNWQEFVKKAEDFYKFWLPGRVVVNGEYPTHDVGEKITDSLYYSNEYERSYVVMGNVAYRIENPRALFYNTKMNYINFVAYVDDLDTGDDQQPVEFTPSREDLKYTARTKDTLQKIVNSFETDIVALANAEVTQASNHAEAYERWTRWTNLLGAELFSVLEYKGDRFESDFNIKGYRVPLNLRWREGARRISNFPIAGVKSAFFLTECTVQVNSNVKAKVREYCTLKGIPQPTYLVETTMKSSDIQSKWLDKGERFVSWEDVKKAIPKKPKKPRDGYAWNAGRIAGSWDYYTINGYESEKAIPPNTNDLFYATVNECNSYVMMKIISHLGMSDAVVIRMPANRLNKFKRENPKAQNFITYAKSKVVIDEAALLSDEAKKMLSVDHSDRKWLRILDVDRVDDPEIASLVSVIKDEDALLKDISSNRGLASWLKMQYSLTEYSGENSESYLSTAYPLLSEMRSYKASDDLYVYLNAAYAAKKEEVNV